MEKQCFKCGEIKPLTEYYKHPKMADGHLGKCKSCTKNDTKLKTDQLMEDPVWAEAEAKRHRDKYHRLGYKDVHKPTPEAKKAQMETWYSKYPEKNMARKSASGLLKREGYHNHHWSYNSVHYKDVIEIPTAGHYKLHRFIVYDQKFMMYRRKDTNELLDTKEKHISWWEIVKTLE
jgi:hypothetical protein